MPDQHRTPDRTDAQRMEALQRANRVRTIRSVLKRDLKAGRLDWRDVLVGDETGHVHADVASMKVLDLVLSIPKVGRVKARKALDVHRISPHKTLAGLSGRQRAELAQSRYLPGEPVRRDELTDRIARFTHLAPVNQ